MIYLGRNSVTQTFHEVSCRSSVDCFGRLHTTTHRAGGANQSNPDQTNVWVKTYQRWLSQLVQDTVSNIAKEFWPDINHALFSNKF
jgi:hypothetical protein